MKFIPLLFVTITLLSYYKFYRIKEEGSQKYLGPDQQLAKHA